VSGGEIVPDFVTHYYRASRAPLLNRSDLPDARAMAVMAELIQERREGRQQRPFGRTYIEMRRVAEDRLRRRFTALGGRPARRAPHYFVLGESPWFRGLAADMEEVRCQVEHHRGAALRVRAREKPCAWASTIRLPARRSARERRRHPLPR
jgi:hypothetical protein